MFPLESIRQNQNSVENQSSHKIEAAKSLSWASTSSKRHKRQSLYIFVATVLEPNALTLYISTSIFISCRSFRVRLVLCMLRASTACDVFVRLFLFSNFISISVDLIVSVSFSRLCRANESTILRDACICTTHEKIRVFCFRSLRLTRSDCSDDF